MASLRPLSRLNRSSACHTARMFCSSGRKAQDGANRNILDGLESIQPPPNIALLEERQLTKLPDVLRSPSSRISNAKSRSRSAPTATAAGTSSSSPNTSSSRYDLLRSYGASIPRNSAERRADIQRGLRESEERKDWEQQMTRKFKEGDVYAPHDLSAAEARKWKAKKNPVVAALNVKGKKADAFDLLKLNPLKEYKVCFASSQTCAHMANETFCRILPSYQNT
jgi:hypothetical protein